MSRKEYTSYENYLGPKEAKWVNTNLILDYFKSKKNSFNSSENYRKFVEDLVFDSGDYLGKYAID